MEQFLMAAVTIVVGVVGCIGYFFLSNMALDAIYPARGENAGANITTANNIRPWLFLLPAIVILTIYLVYPVFVSVYYSFMDKEGDDFVGIANYTWMVGDEKFRESMVNNMLWLIVVPALSTFFGLLAAALTDRIRWGNFAKAMIFMPMA
ncbi:MAG: alpha-glucoside ABC transporter permease, partial [Pseudomonadota bacterium]